ncbi:ESPR domain-containing protein, partial [Parasutterella excrementihominis]|uniref:ESPR domain-containing protein n=1 Tax=Parasutterella excrementihominis TaxID=487175 RepID=UPI003FF00F12
MNKIYKTFFNSARGCIVVANELSTSKSKSATKTVVASVAMAVAGLACAAAPEYITPPTKLEANEFSFVENSGNTNPYKTITSTSSSELENLWVTGSGAGSKATGYWVDSDGQEATFTNLGNIYVTAVDGANSWSQRAIGAADGATAINKGTIVVQNAYGMTVGSDKNGSTPATIINEGSIAVYETGAAIELGGVKSSTAENKGQIYVGKPSASDGAFTIGVLVKDHEEGKFTNSGLIDAKEATAAISVEKGSSTDKNTVLLTSGSQTLGNILIDAPNTTLNMEDGAVFDGRLVVSKNASKTAISGTQKAEGLTASNGAALFLAPADSSASIKNAL